MWAYVIKNMAMQTKRDSFKMGIRAMQGYRMQAEIFRNGNTVGGSSGDRAVGRSYRRSFL